MLLSCPQCRLLMEPVAGEDCRICLSCSGVWYPTGDSAISENVIEILSVEHACPSNNEAFSGLPRYCPTCAIVPLSECTDRNRLRCPQCRGTWTIVDVARAANTVIPVSQLSCPDTPETSGEIPTPDVGPDNALQSSAEQDINFVANANPISVILPTPEDSGPIQLDVPETAIQLPNDPVPDPMKTDAISAAPISQTPLSQRPSAASREADPPHTISHAPATLRPGRFKIQHVDYWQRGPADRQRWCPLCFQSADADTGRCFQCGVALVLGSYLVPCGSCGQEMEISMDVCPTCGGRTHRGNSLPDMPKSLASGDAVLNQSVSPLWILLALLFVIAFGFVYFGN